MSAGAECKIVEQKLLLAEKYSLNENFCCLEFLLNKNRLFEFSLNFFIRPTIISCIYLGLVIMLVSDLYLAHI